MNDFKIPVQFLNLKWGSKLGAQWSFEFKGVESKLNEILKNFYILYSIILFIYIIKCHLPHTYILNTHKCIWLFWLIFNLCVYKFHLLSFQFKFQFKILCNSIQIHTHKLKANSYHQNFAKINKVNKINKAYAHYLMLDTLKTDRLFSMCPMWDIEHKLCLFCPPFSIFVSCSLSLARLSCPLSRCLTSSVSSLAVLGEQQN